MGVSRIQFLSYQGARSRRVNLDALINRSETHTQYQNTEFDDATENASQLDICLLLSNLRAMDNIEPVMNFRKKVCSYRQWAFAQSAATRLENSKSASKAFRTKGAKMHAS